MADYILSNLPRVTLDPRNEQELLEKALATVASASQGQLTDFTSSSVAGSILKGQVFAHMELKWYLNKVVVAIAVELLRLFGVVRGLGTPARGLITIVLKNTLLTPYVLPEGFKLGTFVTTEQLTIAPGVNAGDVNVISLEVGTATNVEPLGLYLNSIGTYVAYAYNKEALEGGTDIEPLEETVARGQRAIRQRTTLVTVTDYEEAAKLLLGYGSQATCFPGMNLAYQEFQQGHVHVVCSMPSGQPPAASTCASVRESLLARSFATASVWVSPVSIFQVSLDVVVNVNNLGDISDDTVLAALRDYLLGRTLGDTIKIKELEYLVRSIPGIVSLQYVTINGDALDTPLPGKVYAPRLVQLILTKVNNSGISETTYPEAIIDPD